MNALTRFTPQINIPGIEGTSPLRIDSAGGRCSVPCCAIQSAGTVPPFGAYHLSIAIMRKSPLPGAGWYGPFHRHRFTVPSQWYPHFVPQRVTCVQTAGITGVVAQWSTLFQSDSLDGVPAADRKSMVYDFPPIDPTGPWYSSCRVSADPGFQSGYFSQRWEFVYGYSTIILPQNYKWGPFTTAPQAQPLELVGEELGNGQETNTGFPTGLARILIRPSNWNRYPPGWTYP